MHPELRYVFYDVCVVLRCSKVLDTPRFNFIDFYSIWADVSFLFVCITFITVDLSCRKMSR